MRSILGCLILAGALSLPARAQLQDNRDPQMECGDTGRGDRESSCEIREQTIGAAGRIDVEGLRNGGATVRGWQRNDVLVRARVSAWADSQAEAQALASQVRADVSAGRVQVSGPENERRQGWSVSLEIFAPHATDVNLSTRNGGINISDIQGRIEFESRNGGVNLARVGGDVQGTTRNGGVSVELAGATFQGRSLEVSTRNGGVTLAMPDNYSAHVETETRNGRVNSDFPVTVTGDLDARDLNFDVGSGGPLIRVTTRNGGIRLRRL